MRLSDKPVIVTGAGYASVKPLRKRLSSEGANSIAVGINEENLRISATEIRKAGGVIDEFTVDITKLQQIKGCVDQTLENSERLTSLSIVQVLVGRG